MPRFKDITGTRFGKLVAVSPTDKRKGTNVIWLFKCDCGNEVERDTTHLTDTSSCGCSKWSSLRRDITGQKFGRLTAIEPTDEYIGRTLVWKFRCDCGNEIKRAWTNVAFGNTRSCGCLKRELKIKHKAGHKSLIGNRYGSLTVKAEGEKKKYGELRWICRCDCGNTIEVTTEELTMALKRSCGCSDNPLYCVFKHVAPDGRVYIGSTSRIPWRAWSSGARYQNHHAMKRAIEEIGGFTAFLDCFEHFALCSDGTWKTIIGCAPLTDTNYFSKEESEELKRKLIKEYNATDPRYGFNATSGGERGYVYTEDVKSRQSGTHSGNDRRTDWCVYIHKNKINGKIYVGKTCKDPKERWANGLGYKRERGSSKSLSHFFNAIEKYGWDNFEHEIIRTGMTNAESSKLERELIKMYDSTNPDKGYNITRGGEGALGAYHSKETKEIISKKAKERIAKSGEIPFKGQHHSDETKAKLSQKAKKRIAERGPEFKGKHHTDEVKAILSEQHSVPVTQYDLMGKKIRTYVSGRSAAKEHGVSLSSISACCNKRTKVCAGYIWRHLDVDQLSESEMPNMLQALSKRISQYTLNEEYIQSFDSLKAAAEATGLSPSSISASIYHKGGAKQSGGFIWKYDNDD